MSDHESSEMGDDDLMGTAPSYRNADEVVTPQVYMGHRNRETVKDVNFCGPNCEYVVRGSDCGRIFIWKKKGGEVIRVMEADIHAVNCNESHPQTMVLASSGVDSDIKIWTWTPKALERATLPDKIEQKSKTREWVYRISSSQDLMLQLFSLHRRRTSQEGNEENSAVGREQLDLILTFNANSDVSIGADDDGDDAMSQEDHLFS